MKNKKSLEALRQEKENTEREIKIQKQRLKSLEHQKTMMTRQERTHRLCTHGAMLEKHLNPDQFTDDEIALILKLIFHKDVAVDVIKSVLKRRPEGTD